MNNSFYHEIEPSFNIWFVIVVVAVIAMISIGYFQYELLQNGNKPKVQKRYNDRLYKYATGFFTVLFGISFAIESWQGTLQMLDNGLGVNDSPVWSVIVLPFVILFITGLFGIAIYYIGRFAAHARYGYLVEQCREMRRKVHMKHKAQKPKDDVVKFVDHIEIPWD